MSWLLVACAAEIILGTSAVFDKMLLTKRVFDPFVYTFWLAILGVFAILLLPFGFASVSFVTGLEAVSGGVFFIAAMLFLFLSLHKSEASKSLLLIGSLTPIFTLLLGYVWLTERVGFADLIGFGMLVLSVAVLFFIEDKSIRLTIGFWGVTSALCFGFADVLMKNAFDNTTFVTGFFWVKMGGLAFALMFFLFPELKKRIFASFKQKGEQKHHTLYLLNRGYAAGGSVLASGAIFLTHPALVEATQGVKFITIFIASWLLLHEHFKGKVLFGKIVALCAVAAGLLWIGVSAYANAIPVNDQRPIVWGLTFSDKMSKGLGLDWQENFQAIMDELHPPKVRLVAYWDEIEPSKGAYDFNTTDWLMKEADQGHANIVLALGMKAPRWPECHIPDWAQLLGTEDREEALRTYMQAVVKHYRSYPGLAVWQVENEPYLAFGNCPVRGQDFLQKEVSLVRSLDASHSILTTDGGEFGRWYKAAEVGDIFGTTMYRRTYTNLLGPYVGATEYPLTPSFFRLKDKIVHWIIGDSRKPFIVAELQGEPWSSKSIQDMTADEVAQNFSPDYFKGVIEYAKQTGFSEYYLWGAEWWYQQKLHGNPQYWDIVKSLFTR